VTRNALGKGLGALIRDPALAAPPPPGAAPSGPAAAAAAAGSPAAVTVSGGVQRAAQQQGVQQVDIDLLDSSPFQPRTRFAEAALAELAQSIEISGIVQPLVARRTGARYQLIAGERRWRAAQRAGLLRVPVILRDVGDEEALEITLVENIQREDLNAVEQARAFLRLIEQFHLTQEEVAARTGKDRATVANSVRLLSLAEPLLQWIEEGKMTAGHGRALLAVDDPKLRMDLAQKASRGKLTVRQLERMATRKARNKSGPKLASLDANRQAALDDLQKHIGTRVLLQMPGKHRTGQLILEFYDEEQLQGLYARLMADL